MSRPNQLQRIKAEHGEATAATYRAWVNFRFWIRHAQVGGKMQERHPLLTGVTYPDEWNDFWTFLAEVGPKPDGSEVFTRKDFDVKSYEDNWEWTSEAEVAKRALVRHRLSDEEIAKIKAKYVAADRRIGPATAAKIAEEHGIHRCSVSKLLRTRGGLPRQRQRGQRLPSEP